MLNGVRTYCVKATWTVKRLLATAAPMKLNLAAVVSHLQKMFQVPLGSEMIVEGRLLDKFNKESVGI